MKEFEVYDAMMAEYYKSRSMSMLPISSWEFCAEHATYVSDCKEDINSLKEITKKWDFKENYTRELVFEKSVIVITNPNLKIVYATHNIKYMNGYDPSEVIGNSPKMFQGVGTCADTSRMIRKAVEEQRPFEACILNYKKDASTYDCKIKGFPVMDKKGKLVNYIAFERVA